MAVLYKKCLAKMRTQMMQISVRNGCFYKPVNPVNMWRHLKPQCQCLSFSRGEIACSQALFSLLQLCVCFLYWVLFVPFVVLQSSLWGRGALLLSYSECHVS